MNERIRELWEESTGATIPAEGFYSSASTYNIEKFAELIIRECLNQLQELTPLKISNEEHQKLVDATHIAAVSIGVAKIKQHFGVEK